MLVSLKLLSYFVEFPKSNKVFSSLSSELRFINYKDLADILTRQGIEVEDVKIIGEDFNTLVVGCVKKVEKHPSADKLSLCQVSLGDRDVQIVCGAKNVCESMWVAVALPGTRINENLTIKESMIRGVSSEGMLCSREELGLKQSGPDFDGIWDLSLESSKEHLHKNIGKTLFSVLDIEDILFDVSVTPNRPDCLCHYGIAREVFVGLKFKGEETSLSLRKFDLESELDNLFSDAFSKDSISFQEKNFFVENTLGCSSFFILMEGVKVDNSPPWMRHILESLDVQPVNNIVDILNYILLCFGQPSHAFDRDKIESHGNTLFSLRFAHDGESFRGLDGKDVSLSSKDCVVSDSKGVLALLGIMGGESSKVDLESKNIILEFVNPNPVLVRKSSRRHGKQTSSAFAFEKGIDSAFRWFAASLSVSLIKKMTKGHYLSSCHGKKGEFKNHEDSLKEDDFHNGILLDTSVLNYYELKTDLKESSKQGLRDRYKMRFDSSAQSRILGDNYVTLEESYEILDSLGFSPKKINEKVLELRCPHHRLLDIEGEADVVEEVIRVKGIDSIEAVPMQTKNTVGKDDRHFSFFETISTLCSNLGYREVLSFHFMKDNDFQNLRLDSQNALGYPVKVINPIIKDESFMQLTLIPDLLRKTAKNIHFGKRGGQLFHISRTFQNMDVRGQNVFHINKNSALLNKDSLSEYDSKFSLLFSKEKENLMRPSETPRLACVAFGVKEEKSWLNNAESLWSIYDLMAHVRDIFKALDLRLNFEPLQKNHPFKNTFHPKKALGLSCYDGKDNILVGSLGEFHPDVLGHYDISLRSFGFEINIALILSISQSVPKRALRYESLQSFPIVEKDFAFVLKEDILASKVTQGIEAALIEEFNSKSIQAKIRDVFVFDVFCSEGIPKGMKSFAIKVRIEPLEKTFTDSDIKGLSKTLVSFMTKTFEAVLREG